MLDKTEFNAGYDDGSEAFIRGERISCQDTSNAYRLGFWVGWRYAEAFRDGSLAHANGVLFCPYVEGSANGDLRDMWLEGYWSQAAKCAA